MATVVARSAPTVSAVASFSTQHVSRRPSGSRSEEGQRQGVWSSQGCGQRFPPAGATSQCNGTVSCSSNNAFQCLQIKLSRQPDPESPNSSKCSPRWLKEDDMFPAVQEALEGRVPSTRTTCVRAHPLDQKFCRTETKVSRQGSNRESARGSELGHGPLRRRRKSCSQRENGGLQS